MPTKPRFELIAIVPKRPVSTASQAKVSTRLRTLGLDMVRAAANYPRQRATSYRRTGDLGRGWSMKGPFMQGSDLVVEVGNKMGHASFVMGFKSGDRAQLRQFANLGWQSIEDIAKEEVTKAKSAIEQVLQEH